MMIDRIADEHVGRRASIELVACHGRKVRVPSAAEHPNLVVAWRHAKEEGEWHCRTSGAAGMAIDEVSCHGERLCPKL